MEKELPAFRQRRELMAMLKSETSREVIADRLIFMNNTGRDLTEKELYMMNSLVPALQKITPDTDIVLWRSDLFNAAIYGNEIFITENISPEVLPFKPQWWAIEGEAHRFEFGKFMDHLMKMKDNVGMGWPKLTLQSIVIVPWFKGSHIEHNYQFDREGYFLFVYYIMRNANKNSDKIPYLITCSASSDSLLNGACAPAVAALSFMQQQFVTTRKAHTGKRMRLPSGIRHQSSYDVVVLRRKHTDDPRGERPDSEREYHHSWGVKGHWRKLHQPRARDGSKFTFIESYIKGDPDKPFLPPKDTIIRVKR